MTDYIGTELSDTFSGTAGIDIVNGLEEADSLSGLGEDDLIMGHDGADTIAGGDGDDILDGDGYFDGIGPGKTGFYVGADHILGDAGADSIFGGRDSDYLDGGADNDEIWGDASGITTGIFGTTPFYDGPVEVDGNDPGPESAPPGPQDDTMIGGAGADTLHSWLGADQIFGGGGIDLLDLRRLQSGAAVTINMGLASQTLADGTFIANVERLNFLGGGLGDDATGGNGSDTLDGGSGDDTLSGGGGDDTILSIAGVDVVDGGLNNDLFVYNRSATTDSNSFDNASPANLITFADGTTATGIERLFVTLGSGLDFMGGGVLGDTLNGGDGADTMLGRGGEDILVSGGGADSIDGGNGVDIVRYWRDSDVGGLTAILNAPATPSSFSGGVNLINVERLWAIGGSGADSLGGASYDDTLNGGAGADTVNGGKGNDVLYLDTLSDVLIDAKGVDTIRSSISLSLADYAGFENLSAHGGNAILLTGDGAANVMRGDFGQTTLDGAGGDDTIIGGESNDIVIGGAGNDLLMSGDPALGYPGFDTVSYETATAAVSVSLGALVAQNTGGAGIDTLAGFDALTGSDHNDTLTGSASSNSLMGGEGADSLNGGGGDDTLVGGLGNDTLNGSNNRDIGDYRQAAGGLTIDLTISAAQDTKNAGFDKLISIEDLIGGASKDTFIGDGVANDLRGEGGDDILKGGAGADTLTGGDGVDRLTGGADRDLLYGDQGADFFIFDIREKLSDTITFLEDIDTIDLSKIDANTHVNGDQAFVMVTDFTGTEGEARLIYKAGESVTLLQLDVNGDSKVDMTVTISGDHDDFTNFTL